MQSDNYFLEKVVALSPCVGTLGSLHVEARAVLSEGPCFPFQWGDERSAPGRSSEPQKSSHCGELFFRGRVVLDSKLELVRDIETRGPGRAVS